MFDFYRSRISFAVILYGLLFASIFTTPVIVAAPAPQSITFPVSHFTLEGELPLPDDELNTVLSELEGKDYGLAELQAVTQEVEQLIRDAGFAFYRVILPPQTLAEGEVILKVVSFALGDVEIKGNHFFSHANLLASIPELQTGISPNTQFLGEQLKVANHHPSKEITVVFKQSGSADEIAAKVDVLESRPYQFSLSANNTGSSDTGKARITGAFQYSNLWQKDHIANASYTTSPNHTSEVMQYGLSYSAPLYDAGGWLTAYYARSEVESGQITFEGGNMDVSGAGKMFGVHYLQFLPKVGRYEHAVDVGFDNRFFETTTNLTLGDINYGDTTPEIRSTPLTLLYKGNIPLGSTYIGHHLSWSKNLGLGSRNDAEAYQDVGFIDDRPLKEQWDLFRYGAFVNVDKKGWLYRASLKGQYSNEPLISGEQFGLGGAYSLRGYKEREVGTDVGNSLTLEAFTPQWKGTKLLAFYDYGKGRSHNVDTPDWNLASVGVGLRYQWSTHFQASIDIGHTLKDGSVSSAHETNAHASLVLQY